MSTEFAVERNPNPRSDADRAAILEAPGFGKHFTDHMVLIDWTEESGWENPRVLPYGPISLDPATMALHYGQEIFEGLKAYAQPDGSIKSFRPDANAARFQRSSRRLAMAELPTELFLDSLADAGRHRPRLGACRPGHVAVPASVHDRDRGRARRQQGLLALHLPAHRLARRFVLPRRHQAGQGVALDRVHARGARRHGRGQVRRQLRGVLRRAGARHGAGLRPGRVARRRRAPLGRGDGRDEPVLRVRVRPGRAHRDAGADRARCCPASPATRC